MKTTSFCKAPSSEEEASTASSILNTPSSNSNGSKFSPSSASDSNAILTASRSPSNSFTSRRTFASSTNGSSASNLTSTPSSTSAVSVTATVPSYIVPSSTSTPHLKKEKETSLLHHQRTPSNDTCKSISSISSASSISATPASTSSPSLSSEKKKENGATIGNGNGVSYASVAASKVAPPHSYSAFTVENGKKQLVHEEKHAFDSAKSAASNDGFANDTRDQVPHPITSTPVKNNKFTAITTTNALKKWNNYDKASNNALQTPDWTSGTSSTFFSPSHAAFKYDHNDYNGNGDRYNHNRYQHSSFPSSASTSPTTTSFRPFGEDSNLNLRTSQMVNSTSAIPALSSPSRQDYASTTSYRSDPASRNAEATSHSSMNPATWYGNLEYDGQHNRSLTQGTDASSTYFTNEADTSAATNSSSSLFDYRSVQTGDTSFSSSRGGGGGRGGGDTSFNNSKITSFTSIDHSSNSASPSKHARQASNDGSLYSFDGLADLSMTSFGGDSLKNGRNPLGFDEGNASLSSIPSFNLDDDGNSVVGNGKGKTSTTLPTSLFEENERSDLDRLYHKLNSQTSDHSRILPSSLVFASQDGASSNSFVEDSNFPRSVRDAYRDVKLNGEDQPTRYLFVSGLPMPSPEEGQTMVNEIVEAMKVCPSPSSRDYASHIGLD